MKLCGSSLFAWDQGKLQFKEYCFQYKQRKWQKSLVVVTLRFQAEGWTISRTDTLFSGTLVEGQMRMGRCD